ncbi:MAG: asparagine synthase-related protein [Planctomycetota bacterium]
MKEQPAGGTPAAHAVSAETRSKLARLEEILAGYGSLLIAYSGGVDSAFLAAVAARVLKERALAVTAESESLAPEELGSAAALARQFAIPHEAIRTDELRDEQYAANTLERCAFCKAELMGKLQELARQRGFKFVALGANVDGLAGLGQARGGLPVQPHSFRRTHYRGEAVPGRARRGRLAPGRIPRLPLKAPWAHRAPGGPGG